MKSETSGHLRRVLGVGFGLAVSIGGTIGVGILRTPGLVAEQLHAPLAIVLLWVAGGIYTLLGASCLTELGLMLPRAGGFYVYARRAFGNTAGFAVGWTDWLMYLFDPRIFVDRHCRVHSGLGTDTRGCHSSSSQF